MHGYVPKNYCIFIRKKLYLFLKHCMICRCTVSKNNTINTIIFFVNPIFPPCA